MKLGSHFFQLFNCIQASRLNSSPLVLETRIQHFILNPSLYSRCWIHILQK